MADVVELVKADGTNSARSENSTDQFVTKRQQGIDHNSFTSTMQSSTSHQPKPKNKGRFDSQTSESSKDNGGRTLRTQSRRSTMMAKSNSRLQTKICDGGGSTARRIWQSRVAGRFNRTYIRWISRRNRKDNSIHEIGFVADTVTESKFGTTQGRRTL